MGEIEVAEKAIADLRKAVSDLESDVDNLSSQIQSQSEPEANQLGSAQPDNSDGDDDFTMKKRKVSELITQALLKVDSIQISKDLAAEALRNGERDKSRKVAVLLARRKTIVKKLNMLGDRVDKLILNVNADSVTTIPVDAEQQTPA